jgi:hypothetical protein
LTDLLFKGEIEFEHVGEIESKIGVINVNTFTSTAIDAAELQPDKVDTIVYDPAGAVTVDPEITTPVDGLAVYVCVAL